MSRKNGAFAKFGLPIGFISFAIGSYLPQRGNAEQSGLQEAALEEVVVSAERRNEDVQKTAASVSVRSGEQLVDEGKYSLASILEDIPGMAGGAATTVTGQTVSGSDNLAAGLVIRGLPSNVGAAGITSVASAAAIYVDGIYEGVGGGYDIDRVEVLRGPQGTLYGRSATSGVVSIRTRDPELGKFTGDASVEAGNYNLRHYTGGVNVPLGDTVAIRVSGNEYTRDGFFSDLGGSTDNTDGRIKLLFAPSETFSLLLATAAQNNTTYEGGTNIYLTSPDSTYSITQVPSSISPGENRYRQYWGQLDWDVGFGKLTYMPALRTWESTTDYHQRNVTGSFDQYSVTDKDDFWTHELHLASKPGSKLIWQVGAFYYSNSLHNMNLQYRFPSGAFYRDQEVRRDTTARSLFAEATYPFATDWRVTAGLRYDWTSVQVYDKFINNTDCNAATQGGANSTTYCLPEVLVTGILSGDAGKRTYNKATYKLRLEHDLTDKNLVYAMVSTGVSPGDITLTANITTGQPVPQEIKSETLTAYEIGSKNRFLDDRLQVNGDVFYYNYGGYEVANVNVNGSMVNGVFVVIPTPTEFETLSAPVTAYGFELETLYQATPNDRISLNYDYTNAYFTDKSQPVAGTSATFGDFFGYDTVPNLIPHRASLSYDHTFHLGGGSKLAVGADTRWLSSHNETNSIFPVSKSQLNSPAVVAAITPWFTAKSEFVSDLNGTWTAANGKFSLTAWVRNVFDNQYKQSVGVYLVNANNIATALQTITATPYDPRTYGVSFGVRW